ncbi:hypothetical protein [Cohaesibacter celericrescens]|uniref:Glycosyl hydrolase 36 catalytic domain-containing protein n=1 Tax=Cohaesibacter celericrescens TaxID=2067669 RepID=A0A2N5XVF5_9HYPH|nr:hypothetical protein [Cohaesibacter celericrescens]PLW78470.1 hypothetical protein C0081_04290 [Cohaesibacter celericrescens]
MPGDVAGVGDLTGLGGWSWYTGAASWTWQLAVSSILGIKFLKGAVCFKPCLPKEWGQARVTLSGLKGEMDILIEDPDHYGHGAIEILLDGKKTGKPVGCIPGCGSINQGHYSHSGRLTELIKPESINIHRI